MVIVVPYIECNWLQEACSNEWLNKAMLDSLWNFSQPR